jgi:hypothetical protein
LQKPLIVQRPDPPGDFRTELDLLLPSRLRKWNQATIDGKVLSGDERRCVTGIFAKAAGLDGAKADRALSVITDLFATMQPIQRAGVTDDIANAAVFLASDANAARRVLTRTPRLLISDATLRDKCMTAALDAL